MASITLLHSHKNLIFACSLTEQTGAEFEEDGQKIIIRGMPELVIPHYCFSEVFDPHGQKDHAYLERAWRSLLLNKLGYLKHFSNHEIIISDQKPQDKRPQFLLRFPDVETKQATEERAAKMGYNSLTAYVLDAITMLNKSWSEGEIK